MGVMENMIEMEVETTGVMQDVTGMEMTRTMEGGMKMEVWCHTHWRAIPALLARLSSLAP